MTQTEHLSTHPDALRKAATGSNHRDGSGKLPQQRTTYTHRGRSDHIPHLSHHHLPLANAPSARTQHHHQHTHCQSLHVHVSPNSGSSRHTTNPHSLGRKTAAGILGLVIHTTHTRAQDTSLHTTEPYATQTQRTHSPHSSQHAQNRSRPNQLEDNPSACNALLTHHTPVHDVTLHSRPFKLTENRHKPPSRVPASRLCSPHTLNIPPTVGACRLRTTRFHATCCFT
jgi:hypothetical protein